ncbi:hypothetical protein ACFS5N_07440 [Mucilaginibacter ximonensis]|uniref:Natural product n=1 Tax=Mucilaginibacter ximonensis TaxID=538021 RepID=A0ABW5YA96_9SPHI
MKKLRLKALSLGAREILSREQLKAVTGGSDCNSALDCPIDYFCQSGTCVYSGPPSGSNGSTASGDHGDCSGDTNDCFCDNIDYGCLTYDQCNMACYQ